MGFLSLNDSGTSTLMACGSDRPAMTRYSSTLSSEAESLMSGSMMGAMSDASPKTVECSTLSRACIQRRLPRMVLISPLCANRRKGWASAHVGKVFVLKRECTSASPLVR